MMGVSAPEMNPAQRRAVEHGDGPLMVLAGAGSGKTRVLVHRIARLVERRVPAHRILAVTFSNKAAGEMRERLGKVLGDGARSMWVGTFHSTCAKLLRIHGELIGLGRDFAIFDDDDQMRLVTALLKAHELDEVAPPRAVLSAIDRAKNRGDDPARPNDRFGIGGVAAKIYPHYRDALARENAVDFNDLLLKVLELAAHPEGGPLLAGRFDHVLVDEFQDTNLVQYRLVRELSRATNNLTVVGDDDQAIYGWRGAEPKNLLHFDRDFPDAAVVKLEQNYRSTQMILTAANAIIERNLDRHAKHLWTERGGGEPILWEEAADDRGEAEFVARAIRGLVSQEGREHGDVAVLYRTHAQSRVLEEMMRLYRIGYRIVGGLSFFQRKEIKDVRAYLRLVGNPASDTCFERVVNVPPRGIGKATLDRVRAHARAGGVGLLDAARECTHGLVATLPAAARKKLAGFVEIIDGLRQVQAAGASVAELIIQTVERSGYRERLEAEDTAEARERVANLSELVTMAADFDDETGGAGEPGNTLIEFEERISLASALDESDGRGQSVVSLMTIHAAKGLEFPVVFVCGMEEGMFPSLRPREDTDDRAAVEEERRLAYVAFTRAMERLILTSARLRRQWAEVKMNRTSRFVEELPPDCLAVRTVRPAARPSYDDEPRARPMPASLRRPSRAYDEHDQRSHDDDVEPVYHLDEADDPFASGTRVMHEAFGSGRVVDAHGSGQGRKLVIDFPEIGRKTVLARFVRPD
jgi:DNA helicase-2/ATP-dependent DNA helicase PcrA